MIPVAVVKVQQNLAEHFSIIWYDFEQKNSHKKSPLSTDLSILDLSVWMNIKRQESEPYNPIVISAKHLSCIATANSLASIKSGDHRCWGQNQPLLIFGSPRFWSDTSC